MKRLAIVALAACLPCTGLFAQSNEFTARLAGTKEVPAISTVARGEFRAYVASDGTLHYLLRYSRLEGAVTQAHVHFGQKGVNGGISFFLCTNLGNGPAGTQACPAAPGEISGIITPDLVVGPGPVTTPTPAPGQGIEPGALEQPLAPW